MVAGDVRLPGCHSISEPSRGCARYISVMAKLRPTTTAPLILFANLCTCAAQADDGVRPGKWVFSAVVSEPRAPLGAELRSNGLTLRETQCITSDNPLPPMARRPSTPRYGYQSCKIDQTNGVVHYHGVTLDGEYTVHGIIPGQLPIDRTMPVTGLYLRPCDGK